MPISPPSPLSREPLGRGRSSLARVSVLALFVFAGITPYADVVWTAPGEIRVVVIDRDGSAIVGVSIELCPQEKGGSTRRMTTGVDGHAVLKEVPGGEYMLKFYLSGFVTCSIGPFEMRSGDEENPHLPEFKVMMNPIRLDG